MKITRFPYVIIALALSLLIPAVQADDDFSDLSKDLVQREGSKVKKAKDIDLSSKKYVAFYYSAHWCPPCRAYTPKLSKWYDDMKKEHGDTFELVFVSSDRSEEAMEEYMDWGKMNFPAITFDERRENDLVKKHAPRGIPHLIVLNQKGESVFDKGINRNQILGEFEKLLKKS